MGHETIATLRADQYEQWRLDNRVAAEAYIGRHRELGSDPEAAVDLIYGEYLLRLELGERPLPDEYLERFPQFGPLLRRQFEFQAILAELCPEPSGSAPPPRAPTAPGAAQLRVGPYQLLEPLGRGGMGVVYKGRHARLGRLAAVKVALAGPLVSPEARARFDTEGQAVARLRHPGVVCLYEFGEQDGLPYFAMEYLDGGSLTGRLAAGPLPPREAAALVRGLAEAVQYAHDHRVVHRDLKPSNVLLGTDGAVKLSDFGLAKLLDAETGQTVGPTVLGTASYMSPEQARGDHRAVGPPADVYGLGAVLYECLTGRPPFRAETRTETLNQVLTVAPPAPTGLRPGLPGGLEAVCLRCLEKDPADRYPSAGDLARDLDRWLAGRRVRAHGPIRAARAWARRWRKPLTALAVAAGLVLAAVLWPRGGDSERALAQAREALARGEPVTLIGDSGGPGWSRWRFQGDPGQAPVSRSPGGQFAIQSWQLGLLEVLPEPLPKRFRFSAEVRHLESHEHGEVGLFVGYREHPTPGGPVQQFVQISFNDIRTGYRARLGPRLYAGEGTDWFWDLRLSGAARALAPPAGFGQTGWRRLTVEVTPARLRGWWGNDQQIGEIVLDDLDTQAATELTRMPDHLYAPHVRAERFGTGGLGLFVHRGSAAFRAVAVHPLPED